MKKLKLILFDIDNTLVFGESARKYYRQYGPLLEKTISEIMGISMEQGQMIANEFRLKFDGRGEKAFEVFDENMSMWNRAICSLDPFEHIVPNTKVSNILTDLKKAGYVLGVVTDGPTVQAYKILKAAGIDREVFNIFIGWEFGMKMPKGGRKDVYKKIISQHNLKPDEIMMVGDSILTDISPAHECGMQVLYINEEKHNLFPTSKTVDDLINYIN